MREARTLGLVTVQERRRRGQPSLTNIVRVISANGRRGCGLDRRGGGADFFKARGVGLPKKESGDNYFSIKAIKAAEKAVGGIKSKDADDVTNQGVRATRKGLR